ncbi:MAG TPA: tRNA pseudouridine(55) synthase TruB [Conexibacter sp.]|nr:tRNA pseudouridine(55) synthase TruB [Conexibacter sp.]
MDGVILFDKPAGVTSHDVVARVRRRLGKGTKVGHAGTLDPFATGLLLVLVGRATRVQRFLMALPKSYVTVARFGATSSTGDREGEIVETGVVPAGDVALPTGAIRQRPPAYSAVRVGGVRAYKRARQGEDVELPEREVAVYAFDELARDRERRTFAIRCSAGTYVRSLVADLGDAYCEELRRTAIGPFSVADADPERVVPLGEALAFLPEARLTGEEARRAAHGVAVCDPLGAEGARDADRAVGPVVRLTDDQGVIALAEPRRGPDGSPLLKPVVGLRG